MTGVPIRTETQTLGETTRDNGGPGWGDAAKPRGVLRATCGRQGWKRLRDPPPEPWEGAQPTPP